MEEYESSYLTQWLLPTEKLGENLHVVPEHLQTKCVGFSNGVHDLHMYQNRQR